MLYYKSTKLIFLVKNYKINFVLLHFQLTQAQDGVNQELQRLDTAKDSCLEKVNVTFQQIQTLLDKRKQEMLEQVEKAATEKRKVLEEQHSLIESEKNKVSISLINMEYIKHIYSVYTHNMLKWRWTFMTDLYFARCRSVYCAVP